MSPVAVPADRRFHRAHVKPARKLVRLRRIPLSLIKYADEDLPPAEAVRRAQDEAREKSREGSDFLPVSFQFPVSVCVARVAGDFRLQSITCLDEPQFRTREIV